MSTTNLLNLTREEFLMGAAEVGVGAYHAGRIWKAIFRDLALSISEIGQLKDEYQKALDCLFHLEIPQVDRHQESQDGYTRKFLLVLNDRQKIETVIMRHAGRRERPQETLRYTACISSQAGCAMGCVFCATGQMGFSRHLSADEIVGQIFFVQRELRQNGHQLRNIVLMGMGEPLHNYDNTMKAIDILTDPHGFAIAPRHITLSTVGLPDGIRRLAEEKKPINLAVSLHGANDEARAALVPPARRWPLTELLDACRTYIEKSQKRIFFEWALIASENDTPEQAHKLGALLAGLDAHVNVIPLNPTSGYSGRPSDPARVKAFQAILRQYGLPSTVRQRRGIDIAAGCGQLANL